MLIVGLVQWVMLVITPTLVDAVADRHAHQTKFDISRKLGSDLAVLRRDQVYVRIAAKRVDGEQILIYTCVVCLRLLARVCVVLL